MWNEWNSKKNYFKKYEEVNSKLYYGSISENIPQISIVIPTYRRGQLLKQALDSALAQVNFGEEYEIIVVDNDCLIDNETDDLMKQYTLNYPRITYYRNEKNIGSFGNWNRCIELCRTNWLCLLHDDDLLSEDYLCKISPYLSNNKLGLLGVYVSILDDRVEKHSKSSTGNSYFVDLFIKLRRGKPIPITLYDNMRRIHVLSVGILINKNKAIDVGGFDDRYYPIGDAVFYSKMSYYYETIFLPLILSHYRISNNDSLGTETCINNVGGVFFMTKAIITSIFNGKRFQLLPKINAIIQEDSNNKFNPNVDYTHLWNQLGMNNIFNSKVAKMIIIIYYKLLWAMLFFRTYKGTNE